MNQLVQNIIKPFLPEEQKPGETIAVYGGSYKPPTLGHFEVVNKALKEYPEITRFIVYVGAGIRDGITQEESVKIWEIYKRYLPLEIKAVPNPITAIYDFAKTHPNDSILWVLGSRPGNEADFDDFKKRTKAAETRPNLVPVNIVTDLDISGTKVRQNLKDKEYVFKSLPPISQPEKQEVYNILMKENVTPDEAPSSKTSYQTLGLKTIRVVVEGEGLEKDKEKVLALIKKQSPNSKVDFYPATGKIVGIIEANKLDSIKRDLSSINKDYKISEKKQQLKEEEKIPGGLAKGKSLEDIAKHHGLTLSVINKALEQGIKTEMEHTTDKDIAKEIAVDHLWEDPKYYTKLGKIEENKLDKKILKQLIEFLNKKIDIKPLPKLKIINNDKENSEGIMGKTAYYDPLGKLIVVYTFGRHPRDIYSSIVHEFIHHNQNLENRLGEINTQNVLEDDKLQQLEKEAYEKGGFLFREFKDSLRNSHE